MRSAYGAKENHICQHQATIVVDVANVMGSRPDGWWRDRAGAAVRLHAEVAALAASGTALPNETGPTETGPTETGPDEAEADEAGPPRFVMVLEGAARAAAARIDAADRVQVVQAAGSGDDAIVAVVADTPGRCFVVTADRELRRRCEAAGASILGPGWLLGLFGPR
jgi:hypothetical protein